MRSGDYINLDGWDWTVALVFTPKVSLRETFRSGRHALLVAADGGLEDGVLTLRIEHEDDILAGWRNGPDFAEAQIVSVPDYSDQACCIHAINGPLVSLVDLDYAGVCAPYHRWQLSLLANHPQPFSFENAVRVKHGAVDA